VWPQTPRPAGLKNAGPWPIGLKNDVIDHVGPNNFQALPIPQFNPSPRCGRYQESTMTLTSRRTFVIHLAAASGAALACGSALAAPPKLEENDPKAVSLGYRHASAQVDAKRFPKHTATEKCNNCMAWLGKSSDPWGECDLTPDRLVNNGGWCSSYVKAG
jgi:hypothetical protein